MKNISTIRMKVTLWYAGFMMLLILISFLLIVELAKKSMTINQQEHVIGVVQDGIDDYGMSSDFDYFHYGVYILIYQEDQTYQDGIIPDDFSVVHPLMDDHIQIVTSNDKTFYVYDQLVNREDDMDYILNHIVYQGETKFWIRGVALESAPDLVWDYMIRFMAVFMLAIALISCIVGYFITKKAFQPVRIIQETAQKIADSNELSLRIGLPHREDEISMLGSTVDHMLNRLERSFEKEKQFTSDVSHELRTPLAVVLNESEYALTYANDLDEMKESMQIVNRHADRMSVLINQLLFFTRTDADSFQLKFEEFDFLSVINMVIEDYKVLGESDDITIAVLNNSEQNTIKADKILFTRCIANIIQNAITYRNLNHNLYIQIIVSKENDYLSIQITDNGIGIALEHIGKIWDRFYQVEESRNKEKGSNMGLGLAMVKTIVEKHKGYVTVESFCLKGSTFTLYFPNLVQLIK